MSICLFTLFTSTAKYVYFFPTSLDCGAGIGRVAKCLLLPLFEKVDLVEQNREFLEAADRYLVGKSNNFTLPNNF